MTTATMHTPTAAEILTEARDHIAQGWTQGSYHRSIVSDGNCKMQYCSEGAVNQAWRNPTYVWDISVFSTAYDALQRAVREACPANTPMSVIQWNDADGRTQDEVLAVFNRAIQIAEEQA